ncbi:hypothetical protein IIA79_05255, partial [bacterium]|nr:hypothetical protein [bacterium]
MDKEGPQKGKAGLSAAALTGIVVLMLAGAVLGFYAYRMVASPQPTPIGDILADLRKYDTTAVTIRGEVTQVLNVLV